MKEQIKILYFASLKDKLGLVEEDMPLVGALSVREIKNLLLMREGKWQVFAQDKNVLSALNHVMVKDDVKVRNGDELAFFPPVTGG